MKIGLILALALTLVAISSAATDEEILRAAKTLLLSNDPAANVTIIGPDGLTKRSEFGSHLNITMGKDTLMIAEDITNDFVSAPESYIGHRLLYMTEVAENIFQQCPGRFKKLDLTVYDPSNALIAHATLAASSTTKPEFQSFENAPRAFFPDVKIT